MPAGKTQTKASLGVQTGTGRVDRTPSATPRAGGGATPLAAGVGTANLVDEQLQEAIESERLIDAELENLIKVSGGAVLDDVRATLTADGPVLRSIQSAIDGISALSEKTRETATLADRVSSKIRHVDIRQSRVREVLQHIDAIDERKRSVQGVKRALEAGDLGAAVGCVSQFFDAVSEPSGTAPPKEGDQVSAGAARDDAWQEMREMEEYKRQCEERVRAAVEQAVASDDREAVTVHCQMFGPLKLQKEGVRTLVAYATQRIKSDAKEAYDALVDGFSLSGAKVTYVDALTNLLRDIAEAINDYLDAMRDAFGPECALEGVHTLHGESDVWGARIMARYMEEKELSKYLAGQRGQDGVTGKKIDVSILMELLVMCTRGEEYIKYVLQAMADAAAPNALAPALETSVRGGPFGSSMREVLSYYISLEEVFVEESVAKAISIDQTIPGSLTSSMVDDAFYVLLSAGKRALSTGRAPSAVAVLNQINTVLATLYKSNLVRKLQGCPSRLAACIDGVKGVKGVEGVDRDQDWEADANAYAVVLNDVDLSSSYVEKLRQQLEQVAHQVFSNDVHDDDRIQMVLADLKKTSSDIKRLADQATEQLTTSLMLRMRHTLDSFVAASYEISDAGFEISDEWSTSMLQSFGRTFTWLQNLLVPDMYSKVLMSAVDKIVSRMEAAIAQKSFTQLGGLQLDKDVRALVVGLSELCETSLRDKFGRLGQLATVMGVESVEEAADLIRDELLSLSALDVRSALMQRADVSQASVSALGRNQLSQ